MAVNHRRLFSNRAVSFGIWMLLAACLTPSGTAQSPAAGATNVIRLKVCLVSGSGEYKSEASLTAFQTYLEENFAVICSRVFGQDKGTALPGLEALDTCDVMVLFTRRVTLPPAQLKRVIKYVNAGKPLVGLRTASHAFQNWPPEAQAFDKEVIGGSYQGHYGDQLASVTIHDEAAGHPILAGVKPFTTMGKLYKNPTLAPDVTRLLSAVTQANREPVAWARLHKGGRIFYTSLGVPEDFQNDNFKRMLVNALFWTANRTPVGRAAGPKAEKARGRGYEMDYGSVLGYTINGKLASSKDADNFALKGLAIKLGQNHEATVCFDTELMRYAAGWTGGFLDISRTHLNSYKGSEAAFVEGEIKFTTKPMPGWTWGTNFQDPRSLASGPLPVEWARFRGFYRHTDQVVLSYTVGGVEVLEMPGFEASGSIQAFTRSFHIGPATSPMVMFLCDGAAASLRSADSLMKFERFSAPESESAHVNKATGQRYGFSVLTADGLVMAVAETGTPSGTQLKRVNERIELHLPASSQPISFQIALLSLPRETNWAANVRSFLSRSAPPINPRTLCGGGPAQWSPSLHTKGKLGSGGPYAVDTLTMPEINPWKSWMRFLACDFFSDGRAAISTWNGDVWMVSGIDGGLEDLTWQRHAAGLFEPLGLKIVEDQLYVLCRDRIMRLRDLNGDGEADFYESFNSDAPVGPSYHAFAFDLQTDRAGNFYYTRCGQRVDPGLPLNGGMVKVSRDGSRAEMFATGLRAANGMSIGPNDEITCSDNQGNWMPASRINLVRPGGFYGFVPHARMQETPTDYEKPICWLPMQIDNSSGGQVWVTSDKWGPLQGQLLHTSYGKAALFAVLMEQVDGQAQGGVVQFPLQFDTGIMRGRFHPKDGQLYVCGLKGWQTAGGRDGAFHRVRYTRQTVHLPRALQVTTKGIRLSFTAPLEPASATDEENYAIEQWNYQWSEKYGSPEFSVANPQRQGRDAVAIKSISLSSDQKTVFIEIPDIRPVMQMKIQFHLKAADGSAVAHAVYNTINRVGRE